MQCHALERFQNNGLFVTVFIIFTALAICAFSAPDSRAADEALKNASPAVRLYAPPPVKEIDPDLRASIARRYGQLPLAFEVNAGQVDSSVKLLSRGNGYTLFLTPTEAVLSLRRRSMEERRALPGSFAGKREFKPAARSVIRLKAIGADANPKITGLDELPGKSNYFIGNDPDKWHKDVANYAKAKIEGIYPGIDLVYYGNQRQLEYDWILAPGASPASIRFAVESEADPTIDGHGNLVLDKNGEVLLRKPVIYQERKGARTEIAGGYMLLGKRQVGIKVDAYDPRIPLVIDPVLTYSTYLGGSGEDGGFGIAVDSAFNAYVTGFTSSTNFPTASPYQAAIGGGIDNEDIFVAKLNASGSALVYSTYLGGNGNDNGYGISVDSGNNAYITGFTFSTNFPVVNPYQASNAGNSDVFVTKLNNFGNGLLYSTYLGASDEDGGNDIAADNSGNAYITGYASPSGFPVVNAFQGTNAGDDDAFVAKLNTSTGELTYSTYLGGSGYDFPYSIAIDSSGSSYVAGVTTSTNFPTANALQPSHGGGTYDAFVTKLSTAGNSLAYSTYLGGNNAEYGYSVDVDLSSNAYVTGFTNSINFPTLNPIQAVKSTSMDAFISKLHASGNTLVYSTYLGGNGNDSGRGIAVDSSGAVSITGYTNSTDFPLEFPIQDTYGGGSYNAIIAKLDAAGTALVYSTYLGGGVMDTGIAVAVDSTGDVYVTGGTLSTAFPTLNPLQGSYGGGDQDAFIAKISRYCTTGKQNLCLVDNRFFVEVDWSTLSGSSGKGTAVPLTSDGGYFWFFEDTNVELLVKVKDGRAVNGYFWVFWGAMTDVRYTIAIRDTVTGAVKKIEGYQGKQVSGNDIRAFQ